MFPVLFRIPIPHFGLYPIYSYGVMLGLSLVVGWYLTLGLSGRDGLPKDPMANNYVVTALAAIVGARLLYIATNLSEFPTFASFFAFKSGGLVAYGGFLGGFLGSLAYLKRHKLPLLPWADVAVPSLASGLMITRIGCYLYGCDFGHPLPDSAPAWLKKAGTFPHWADSVGIPGSPAWAQHVHVRGLAQAAEHSLPVHPTQLYESLVGALLLVLVLVLRRNQKFRGQIFLTFTFAYGACRYLLEILRDDLERGSIPPSLPEHILIPLGLGILSFGYVIGFSKAIQTKTIRIASQALAFVPPIALFILLQPRSFEVARSAQFSTSQMVAIVTGFAGAVTFAILNKAADDHPAAAMALNLPARFLLDEANEDPASEKTTGASETSSEKVSEDSNT